MVDDHHGLEPVAGRQSMAPSKYTSLGDAIMKMYFRPCLKIDVVAAVGEIIGILYLSGMSASNLVMGCRRTQDQTTFSRATSRS